MKLYFKTGGTKKLLGSPQTQEECFQMVVADMKSKFMIAKGTMAFPFKSGSTLYVKDRDTVNIKVESDHYFLEE